MNETMVREYAQILLNLAEKRITPRQVVGTGYKNAREEAYYYLAKQLARYAL